MTCNECGRLYGNKLLHDLYCKTLMVVNYRSMLWFHLDRNGWLTESVTHKGKAIMVREYEN